MATELRVPEVGESVTEVQIGTWLKSEGQGVAMDEALVEIESDKATVELPSPVAGVVTQILKQQGEMAAVGELIGYVDESAAPTADGKSPEGGKSSEQSGAQADPPAAMPSKAGAASNRTAELAAATSSAAAAGGTGHVMPAARRLMDEAGLAEGSVSGTGPGGRVLKEDVQRALAQPADKTASKTASKTAASNSKPASDSAAPPAGSRDEEVVPMSMLRRRIAQNLVEAQQTAALLTTFNEIDMTAVMALRKQHKDAFEERHGARLGFLSFFVKACVDALKQVPAINAEVRGTDIAYRHYQDIGIAVGGGKGLVVPILRNAEAMSFAEIETTIADFGARAKANKIALKELQGGTFTISNGGVYGSLLSTPIVNPPQSGILGLHKIEQRPVAVDGQVVVRPMMYVALTYDHRLVDGREAVTFLVRVKECLEDPSRMLMEV
ncbi:2-oxoglutarate dehydrogenase complex dihydrolipoyllysine-residue succinyltransferase [Engelhardtia mirabilis]|uniref:Dihydrolipoyllysine-residue succinyltransferase component of 2-oxoglutarate dehydrogenase complex n=1 Tax=Engelhardtia mirabilis TaxID=2528011 RepID=A0A518BJF9_9BACT|nr:Dihydrolipoyllysine-residue succinyltransferase component of 2-oxoglutarate dehydrogenase complex [Planctomycetes bacterium Pla133]QDV01437.1 Dihydrolipoyllysine-residue succinyltransferase component of 2-oxoglutarate dehydrogenase complex [Planctomycetes bacterium Pla86]